MVQRIEQIHAELCLEPLACNNVLRDREVDVVDHRSREDIASRGGKGPNLRPDELSAGVIGEVSNGLPGSVLQCRNIAANSRCPARIEDHAIAGRVTVLVGIDAALRGGPLAALRGVSACQFPIPKNIPDERILVFAEPGSVVNAAEGEAMTAVESRVRFFTTNVIEVLRTATPPSLPDHIYRVWSKIRNGKCDLPFPPESPGTRCRNRTMSTPLKKRVQACWFPDFVRARTGTVRLYWTIWGFQFGELVLRYQQQG